MVRFELWHPAGSLASIAFILFGRPRIWKSVGVTSRLQSYSCTHGCRHLPEEWLCRGGFGDTCEQTKHAARLLLGENRCCNTRFCVMRRHPHQDPGLTRREVLERYAEYGERQEKTYGDNWLVCRRRLAKPIWHLFHGEKGGKKFR